MGPMFEYPSDKIEDEPIALIIGEIRDRMDETTRKIRFWLDKRFGDGVIFWAHRREELAKGLEKLMEAGPRELSLRDQVGIQWAIKEVRQIIDAGILDLLQDVEARFGQPARKEKKISRPEIKRFLRRLELDLGKEEPP